MSDAERYSKGLAEQAPLYGDEIKDNLADLPSRSTKRLPRFLTEFGSGTSTPGGLTLARARAPGLRALATIGDTSAELGPHGRACLEGRNTETVVIAALVDCFLHRVSAGRRRCARSGSVVLRLGNLRRQAATERCRRSRAGRLLPATMVFLRWE